MPELLVDPDRRVDAARLTALLGVPVTGVEVLEDSSGSANRLRLRLTYEGPQSHLPERMFLKRNLARFGFPAEMYTTEVRVYRDVLPGLGLEQPEVFAIEATRGEVMFSILMEDVGLRPGVRVGSVLDATSVDEVDSLLDTLAHLHAIFWGGPERIAWATPPSDNAPMRFWREIGPRLTHNHLSSGHRAALVDPVRWPEGDWWPAFDRLIELDSGGPQTFLHGDVHAGNVYYVSGGPGGLLDWQLALRGSWALDVTYLLITALSPADRAAHERSLLTGYLERLRGHGIDPPALDDAWERYRQNVLYGVLMWLITPDGVHAEAAQAAFLQRCLSAAEDLETMDALRRSS